MTTPPLLTSVITLAAGESTVVFPYQGIRLTILPGTGATVTYSLVNSKDATSHDTDTQQSVSTKTVIPADWPFYYVSSAGGSARVAVV